LTQKLVEEEKNGVKSAPGNIVGVMLWGSKVLCRPVLIKAEAFRVVAHLVKEVILWYIK